MPEILTGCSYGPISHHSGEIFFIHVGGVEVHFLLQHLALQRLDPPPDARRRRRRDRTSRLSFFHMCGWWLARLAARNTTGHDVGPWGMATHRVGRAHILANANGRREEDVRAEKKLPPPHELSAPGRHHAFAAQFSWGALAARRSAKPWLCSPQAHDGCAAPIEPNSLTLDK